MTWKLYVRDGSLVRQAELDDFSEFTAVLRYNEVDTWALQARNSASSAQLAFPGGIILKQDAEVRLSGPMIRPERSWEVGVDDRTITGVGDNVWLRRRLALPVPTGPPYSAEHDVRTGPAETVLKAYVDANAGPSAPVDRRVLGLNVPPSTGLGGTITGRARFQTLLELLRGLALSGGDLGFRIIQSSDVVAQLEFQVYQPADRTASVVYSQGMQNLRAFRYAQAAAEANYIICGGSGEGAARVFAENGDAPSIAQYGRIESFRDRRDATDVAELDQTIAEELLIGADKTELDVTPVETESLSFGRDYTLGDKVTVVIDGQLIQDVVREVHIRLKADEGGINGVVVPVIGTPGAVQPGVPKMFGVVPRLGGRLSSLERR